MFIGDPYEDDLSDYLDLLDEDQLIELLNFYIEMGERQRIFLKPGAQTFEGGTYISEPFTYKKNKS